VVGRDHRYQYANQALLHFLQRSSEQVIGQQVSVVLGDSAGLRYAHMPNTPTACLAARRCTGKARSTTHNWGAAF
jgi:hypothetical protein